MISFRVWLIPLGAVLFAGLPQDGIRFRGPDGQPLPLQSDASIEEFLRTADVVEMKKLEEGVTGAHKLRLRRDAMRVNAIFRDVNETRQGRPRPSGEEVILRDDYVFEVAAYRLDRLLGLGRVPPVVKRRIENRDGTLQLWIEDSITEKERRRRKEPIGPATGLDWQQMMLFDNLIFNDDRNRGNVLYDASGRLWMIDHTRAFRQFTELPYPEAVQKCDRALWERLQTLTDAEIAGAIGPFLQQAELEALLKRRLLLVEYISSRIAELGPESVLY